MCKLYKNRCQKCQISRGVPCTPLMINQGGGKKSGGWEAQGGPSHPPDFDRGWRHPPWNRLWYRCRNPPFYVTTVCNHCKAIIADTYYTYFADEDLLKSLVYQHGAVIAAVQVKKKVVYSLLYYFPLMVDKNDNSIHTSRLRA